ncbi:MAG: hypothetical protein JRF05_07130 [Deltaproteobacteria bacterium]|jgi:hypothetical protein|nr:hypothetical protein [Deltaproteobacteria bacterium]
MEEKIKKYYTFITVFFILVIALVSLFLYHARREALALVKKHYDAQ